MNKKRQVNQPSGKAWLQKTKKIADLVLQLLNVVLTAPLKIPVQLLKGIRYLALIAGLIKTTTQHDDPVQ